MRVILSLQNFSKTCRQNFTGPTGLMRRCFLFFQTPRTRTQAISIRNESSKFMLIVEYIHSIVVAMATRQKRPRQRRPKHSQYCVGKNAKIKDFRRFLNLEFVRCEMLDLALPVILLCLMAAFDWVAYVCVKIYSVLLTVLPKHCFGKLQNVHSRMKRPLRRTYFNTVLVQFEGRHSFGKQLNWYQNFFLFAYELPVYFGSFDNFFKDFSVAWSAFFNFLS